MKQTKQPDKYPTDIKPAWHFIYFRSGIHFICHNRPSSFRTREPQDDEVSFAAFSIDCHINRFALRFVRWHSEQEIDDYFDRALFGINFHKQEGLIFDFLGLVVKIGRS